jgi:hypothetical protein
MERHFAEGPIAWAVVVAFGMAALTAPPPVASAQAGDGGASLSAAPDGGGPGPSDDPDDEDSQDGVGGSICSCETVQDGDGRLHVCTDSYEREVCAEFSCARGTERSRPCPSRGVQLCCEMPDQDTQSRLYDDCNHPNCESGFRDQCRDFGGRVHEGDCDVSRVGTRPKEDALCAVHAPGSARGSTVAWALLISPGLLLSSRRRARRA